MAFDLKRSYFNDLRERAVAPGAAITEEGQILVYVDAGDGTLAVQPSAGVSAEVVAGFAITDALKYATNTVVEELTAPAGGGAVSLRNTNLVAGELVFNVTTGLALGTPADYTLNATTGVLTLVLAAGVLSAGDLVRATYRYTPTLEEVLATEHERSINNRAQDFFSSVSVGAQEGEIFTTMYITADSYAVGNSVYSGAGGLATSAAAGPQIGIVSQVPGVDDGRLGVKYHLTA